MAESVQWDAEALAIAITPKNEPYRKVLEYHFGQIISYPLPWPWRIAAAAD